jgi:hypothetical protein
MQLFGLNITRAKAAVSGNDRREFTGLVLQNGRSTSWFGTLFESFNWPMAAQHRSRRSTLSARVLGCLRLHLTHRQRRRHPAADADEH